MRFRPIRQIFRPLFGLEHRETTARFLYAILVSGLIVDSVLIILHLLKGVILLDSTFRLFIVLFVFQLLLLFLARGDYINLAAFSLVVVCWAGVTYQIWSAYGVRDVAIYGYVIIFFMAALLVNWRVSIILLILSIAAIWIFAIAEVRGLRAVTMDSPVNLAVDLTVMFVLIVFLIYLLIDTVRHSLDAARASEQKYRNFIERSMEGIWFLAFDRAIPASLPAEEQVKLIYERGYISECNDTLARMYGYNSSSELMGAHVFKLTAEEELNELNYQATLEMVKGGYRSGNRETAEQTRDGRTVYFLNSTVGIVENGHLIGLWGTKLDITALKNTEDALRRSEARTHALLDAVPDMIFEINREGTILQYISSTANDAPTPLVPPEQFLGKSIKDIVPSAAEQTFFAIERTLASGRVYAFEYPLLQGDKNKIFEARVTYLSANTVLVIVRDISLQKWIQGEYEKLIAELERKNAELERFTYTVSHDLKSPLITIKGFLGFLQDDTRSGNIKRQEEDIRRISDAADKMQRLLNDLLELSRIGRLVNEPEAIDFNEMISEVLELLHGRIHGGAVPIRIRVAANLPEIYGDRPRLFEVLQNLVDNAAKFMGDQPNPCIEIGQKDSADNGAPIFFVRDNGVGIDPKFKDRIFGLFDKLDPRTDGTGVGLALVKRIIEVHDGRIWVESEPGKGATFYFTLPPRKQPDLNAG